MLQSAQELSGPIYILHIEDDICLQKAMKRILSRTFGAEVISASSADEVMAVVGQHRWAAIISDWNINGGMSGGDVFNMLQVQYPEACSKYIFMSDDRRAELLATAIKAPYVEKPADPDDICKAVSKTISASYRG